MFGTSAMIGAQALALAASRVRTNSPMNNTNQIDIYADNPVVTLAYRIAVMQKALELGENSGCVQVRVQGGAWTTAYGPAWCWDVPYRIDPAQKPFVMPGYNHAGLDQHVVGLKNGWRLLHREETEHSYKNADLEWFFHGWERIDNNTQYITNYAIYRTKLTVDQLAAQRC